MRPHFPLTRRDFLCALGTGAVSLWLPGDHNGLIPPASFLSACDGTDGRHFIAAFDRAGRSQFMLEAPQRMHAVALNPVHPWQAVFFARRPGTEIFSVDLRSGTLMQRRADGPGRHFCGHGCFSPDGRFLYASENAYEKNEGMISVRDAVTLVVLEEWPSHGRDPHEIRLLEGGGTLVVANGGILTSPDRPGVNLDPEAMQPSLVYLDTSDGKMRGDYRLPDPRLSIRHIDINDRGLVAIALQYEGAKENRVPLLATHSGEDALRLFPREACDWRRLNHYTGSVKYAGGDSFTVAVSSPRGNSLSFWNVREMKMLAQHYIHDVCGVAFDAQSGNFIATTGAGAIHCFDAGGRALSGKAVAAAPEIRWDNHLLSTS